MRDSDRHQPSAAAVITSDSTTPVVSAVSTISFGKRAQVEVAIDEQAEDQRIDGRDAGRFGRREDAAHHAAEQDHRRHQRPERAPERDHELRRMPGNGWRGMFALAREMPTISIRATAISRPGTTPARNSPPIETSAETP